MKVSIYVLVATALSVLATTSAIALPCDGCGCSSQGCSGKSVSSCSPCDKNTIVDVAGKAGSFSTLLAAAKAAGLVDTLKSSGPFTVFAPTDDAFSRIPEKALKDLLKPENKKKLAAILTYHVIPQKVLAKNVVGLKSAKTANGQKVKIAVLKGRVFVDDAQVVKTDIPASNGVIHVIDRVIMPDFRPDIVDKAVSAGAFNTLVAAVKAAGLVETLKGDGPFTVFAPTDEAFAKLPKETLRDLLKPENKKLLTSILTYHVVPGELKAEKVIRSASAKTVNGKSLGFGLRDKNVYVGHAKVVKADLEVKNGVIHVIDTVLIPE